MKPQIERMRKLYGTNYARECRDCVNFIRGEYNKCARYGITLSEASDWAGRWTACGMFGKPATDKEKPVIELFRRRGGADVPAEGQMTLFEGADAWNG